MSLSKPNKLDGFIFPLLLPFSNLPPSSDNNIRFKVLFFYGVTISLCLIPCILYFFKYQTENIHMLRYIRAGAAFCFFYMSSLTYLCYRSKFIHGHFPPLVWIFVILTLLFLPMFIFLLTHKTYDSTESNGKDDNKNKGETFIIILCVLFMSIYTLVFLSDVFITYNFSN